MSAPVNHRRVVSDLVMSAVLDPQSGIVERSGGSLIVEVDPRNPYAAVVVVEGRRFRLSVKAVD